MIEVGKRRIPADLVHIALLSGLCWLFFWRLLTPNPLNQQSLVEGDFSGQFVAFAHYQAQRFAAGEVPLWNPYDLGGFPFLADTQAAVFYPPRLINIAILNASGPSTPQRMYDALQKEMVVHTLLASLFMYAFMRRLTRQEQHSFTAALVSAITFAYGGYLTGYPQLQLAVMEAGIWLPLSLLAFHEGTTQPESTRRLIGWSLVAGIALALSLLAGHPQTTLFFIYLSLGYLAWRVYMGKQSWAAFVTAAAVFGAVGGGIAAVQLLPGWEYLQLTTRGTFTVDAMGNGFPFYDVLQVVLPGMLSLWSPLYFGIAGLMLALYAILRRAGAAAFWVIVIAVALALSFGNRTIVYDIFYNLVPGFGLFRGQERSAYLIALSSAVLAGLGTAALLRDTRVRTLPRRYVLLFGAVIAPATGLFATLIQQWVIAPDQVAQFGKVAFSVGIGLLAAGTLILLGWRVYVQQSWRPVALVGVVVLELFSFGRANPNVESKSTSERLRTPLPITAVAPASTRDIVRIDSAELMTANVGSLFGVYDMRGISPLRLANVEKLLNTGRSREVFAVRYVLTPDRELPEPSVIEKSFPGTPDPINIHRLANGRPFARLVYRAWIEPNDDRARGILNAPSFDAANTVILPVDPEMELPAEKPENTRAEIVQFAPEAITVETHSDTPAILNLALVYYPGWEAAIDEQPAPTLRADTVMTAVIVPAGDHTVKLRFAPRSFAVGAIISLVTLGLVLFAGGLIALFSFRHHRNDQPIPDRDSDRDSSGD